MDVGTRIKQLRKRLNITTKELAELCNTSQPVISKLENGNRIADIPTLEKICNAFNITLADFFNDGTSSIPLTEDLKELVESAKDLSPEQIKAFTQAFKTITKG
ncbi:helix-turn-helix domain-containing protein [Tepidibacter formicigenes]|jgi:transcriptional regulator with XRE-family HTH domain|uniref:Transcriptional regulator, contains XRE-family HTH domain n=1 Tax=Tepidibacter formicigenes DSM 15518 TaxID=1123349 RepID=A0A1M6SLZ1_9FIRM|nr:helix-turn-helix transcriptional regulator [Tepidibacter formicigenes]SHK45656.1 Transcriptional regulator, contains XRE-family HTH domain [Tepidibacter formicigenes DSM 15518]